MEQRRQARVQRRRRAALPIRRRRAAHRHHTLQAARQPHLLNHPRARRRHRAEEGQGVRQQTQPLIRQLREKSDGDGVAHRGASHRRGQDRTGLYPVSERPRHLHLRRR